MWIWLRCQSVFLSSVDFDFEGLKKKKTESLDPQSGNSEPGEVWYFGNSFKLH